MKQSLQVLRRLFFSCPDVDECVFNIIELFYVVRKCRMITCAYEPTPAFQPGESVWLSCPLPWNTHTHHHTNANLIQLQTILLQTFTLTFPGMRTGWLRDPYTSHGIKTDAENTRCVQRCLFHFTPVFFSYIVKQIWSWDHETSQITHPPITFNNMT